MKRTNVVIDEELLEEAVRVSGERTYSRTIERALQELVRHAKARAIDQLAGSGLWRGDLGQMRGDAASTVRETRGVYRTRKRRVPR
jgi:Arc/MetJ family transcription regulator